MGLLGSIFARERRERKPAACRPQKARLRTGRRATTRCIDRPQLARRSVHARRGRARCAPKVEALVDASQPCGMQPTHTARRSVPLERWRGTLGTVEARRRATEVVSCVAGLRRHPSAPRRPPTRGVAPPAARGQVFVRLRTLRATSLCVTFDRASARTLWWVEWHQRRVCSIESQILRAFENAADRATKLQPRTLSRAVLYVFKPIPYESCVFLLTVPGCFVYVTHLFL